jgi:hypothetical protein
MPFSLSQLEYPLELGFGAGQPISPDLWCRDAVPFFEQVSKIGSAESSGLVQLVNVNN